MVSEAPPFWWTKADWRAYALWPFSWVYGRIAGTRMDRARRATSAVPLICIGNFTVGGAGKTPTAIAIARAARARGLKPAFLSRGYGGSLDVTTVVDPEHHRARDVGDEPLLLAREALTVICRRRVDGARKLAAEGADIIIMDDGFQSARLVFDFALLVVDSGRGIGNGHLVPSGPVRAPIGNQLRHANALLKLGHGSAADPLVRRAARAGKPVYVAETVRTDAGSLDGVKVLAWAGIADPEKFFKTVRETGAVIEETRSFPDHHHFSEDEIADLIDRAASRGYTLVTTAKDMVRLEPGHGRAGELAAKSRVIEIEVRFDDPAAPGKIIDAALASARARRLRERKAG
ncbi:tetraacyldisaccharide 4'-kinase [Sinorhizobium meliloti]|jgi:tetraacyldisaccharide 4'-kinase|uniref:tetraacyldisaccharide 4'-kinase n=2 Tax=Rhizobium meliloti TaxID=382 RepID=UPI0003FE440E|nr:tetraacyldisaccharide 4'-kinase [Sinorhizobium meliloti]MCM5688657.1 tetraacyldisaccharide 4'-kinase [Sinorhizobium meliloti]MDE3826142.1 tetraacyldisaccharide 4'-kinase [Sinorhizobium meliloti]MDW9355574.1 tetraacyldisaccharide 4'-kinase [Sinorhizobium meliloti]MDW9654260.1 tetraacyldisaccharide 4'-kinase [Sinorhizobium meliloti]MDW9763007.1 tetraacyldisaccharide 4'-kinase [Sinorhizobium meliloti]